MSTFSYSVAFLMGFSLSLHCAGMCGPIMMVLPFNKFSGFRKVVALLLFHMGRISTYGLLALVLFSFRSVFRPEVQQYVSLTIGAALLLVGLLSFLPGHRLINLFPWSDWVKNTLGRFVGNPGLPSITIAGFLNGLLPCGLVYVALSASQAAPTAWQAVAMMYVFGLGTLPMLVTIALFSRSQWLLTRLAGLRGATLRRLVPTMMLVFGCIFLLRGMNLGIPYLSPKLVVTTHGLHACCCHKMK